MNKNSIFFACEIRSGDGGEKGACITGRPIVYGSIYDNGLFYETIDRGALDGADLSDVRLLIGHDASMIPLARARQGQPSTMELTVDGDGLGIRAYLDTERNSDARKLYSAAERGDITGMSFMFVIDGEEWEDLESDHPTRRITRISRVLEVSAVTFPAYKDTTITARSRAALERARSVPVIAMPQIGTLELMKLKNKILGGI